MPKKIAAILLGDPFPEWQAISLSQDQLAKYAGSYKIDDQNIRKVIIDGSRIFTQRNDGDKQEIFPAMGGIFFYGRLLNYLTFEVNKKGEVVRMIMHHEDGSEKAAVKVLNP